MKQLSGPDLERFASLVLDGLQRGIRETPAYWDERDRTLRRSGWRHVQPPMDSILDTAFTGFAQAGDSQWSVSGGFNETSEPWRLIDGIVNALLNTLRRHGCARVGILPLPPCTNGTVATRINSESSVGLSVRVLWAYLLHESLVYVIRVDILTGRQKQEP